jgi:hypothetical protein
MLLNYELYVAVEFSTYPKTSLNNNKIKTSFMRNFATEPNASKTAPAKRKYK